MFSRLSDKLRRQSRITSEETIPENNKPLLRINSKLKYNRRYKRGLAKENIKRQKYNTIVNRNTDE